MKRVLFDLSYFEFTEIMFYIFHHLNNICRSNSCPNLWKWILAGGARLRHHTTSPWPILAADRSWFLRFFRNPHSQFLNHEPVRRKVENLKFLYPVVVTGLFRTLAILQLNMASHPLHKHHLLPVHPASLTTPVLTDLCEARAAKSVSCMKSRHGKQDEGCARTTSVQGGRIGTLK